MTQHSHSHTWDPWSGWSTISAGNETSFSIWFSGLSGTGKSTLAQMVKMALLTRGYKTEIIDRQALPSWLKQELHIEEAIREDRSRTPAYDAFTTYICALLARNGIITITTSVSPFQETCAHAREQIQRFVEVYLYCAADLRRKRLEQQMPTPGKAKQTYQRPTGADLSIDTGLEPPERSALRIIAHLEQCGYVAPIWEDTGTPDDEEEEIELVKTRLQALGYLE